METKKGAKKALKRTIYDLTADEEHEICSKELKRFKPNQPKEQISLIDPELASSGAKGPIRRMTEVLELKTPSEYELSWVRVEELKSITTLEHLQAPPKPDFDLQHSPEEFMKLVAKVRDKYSLSNLD